MCVWLHTGAINFCPIFLCQWVSQGKDVKTWEWLHVSDWFPTGHCRDFFPIGISNELCMGNNSITVRIFSNDSTLIIIAFEGRQRCCPGRKAMINSPLISDHLSGFACLCISSRSLFQYFKPLKGFRKPQQWSQQRNISSFLPQVCNFCTGIFGSEAQVRSRWSLGEGQIFWT